MAANYGAVTVYNLLLLIHKHIGSKAASKWKICKIFDH